MALHVDDREFYTSHMRKPRGRGHWGFRQEGTTLEFWHTGTFGEAKAALRKHVGRVAGNAYWDVMP